MLAARQVVLAVRDRLIAAATAAGTRVYAGRAWPLDTYPAIRVFATDEDLQADAAEDATWPQSRLHRLQLDVQGTVNEAADPDGAADALAAEILQALEGTQAAARLAPLNCALQAQRIGRQQVAEGEASLGRVTVRFEALFGAESDDPHTIT
jgi:hypothetical protein